MANTEAFVNSVFIGDARDMREIPNESVHLVVTSPPYFNIKDYAKDGYQSDVHSVKKSEQLGDIGQFDQFIHELLRVWRECERVLVPNGKLVINSPLVPMLKAHFTTHENRHIFDLNAAIQGSILGAISNMFLMDTYVWNRTNPSKKLMFGSYPSPPNFYAQNTIEYVTVYVKAGKSRKVTAKVRKLSELTQSEWVEFTKQVWDLPIPNKSDMAFGKHSALMPEAIVERCVRLYSFVGDVILDPFAGSGTTLKVAKTLKRNFVGYEIMESYSGIIDQKVGFAACRKASKRRSLQAAESKVPPNPKYLNKVVRNEAIKFLNDLPRDSVQLICVDPPYNLGKGDWDRFPSRENFLAFTKSWISSALKVLAPGGALFIFNTPENSAHILVYCQSLGLELRNWITWDKRDGFAATKLRFVPTQETILYLVKPGVTPTFNSDPVRQPYNSTERIAAATKKGILKDGKRWFPNPVGKLCTDVWHIVSERHKTKLNGRIQKSVHPTQKPLELIERIVLATTNPGDTVLDVFAGSGTTAVAAIINGRNFLGCDSNSDYVDISNQRIGDSQGRRTINNESGGQVAKR